MKYNNLMKYNNNLTIINGLSFASDNGDSDDLLTI